MRWAAVLVLLLAFPARGGEEPPDPVTLLPGCLRPGAKARFTRSPGGGRLEGTVAFRAEKGEEAGTVRLVREYDTGDRGPLTLRDRLTAVLDAKSRRIRSFTYEVGGKGGSLRLAARLGPDPEKEGGLLHERITYDRKGKARTARSRPAPAGAWTPDLLEPFLVGLLEIGEEGPAEVGLLGVEKGRVSKEAARYELLGRGKMDVAGKRVPCLILTRTRGDESGRVYLRASDLMVLKHGPARLALADGR